MVLRVVFIILIFYNSIAFSDDCLKWFLKTGIKPDTEQCEGQCVSSMVDMGTINCPMKCSELCKTKLPNSIANLPYVKGITDGDRVVIAKYPKESIAVFAAKKRVDELTSKVFGGEGRNDESDAFRHFVWSGYLTKELGKEKAKIFLIAHEQDPDQPKSEMEMDTENNDQGLNFAISEIANGRNVDFDSLEKEALKRLKAGQLKVISPSKKAMPGGYYSK
jgi:hypothetical protein